PRNRTRRCGRGGAQLGGSPARLRVALGRRRPPFPPRLRRHGRRLGDRRLFAARAVGRGAGSLLQTPSHRRHRRLERLLRSPPVDPSSTAGVVRKRTRAGHALRRPANWLQLIKFSIVGASGYVINLAVYTAL